jgi:two-component system, cell cycle response regulator
MSRQVVNDELVPVSDRVRWMQVCRILMLVALPPLAVVTPAAAGHAGRLALWCAVWLAVTLASWPLTRVGRAVAVNVLSVTLLGDGVVLAWAWYLLGDLDGPVGLLVMLHTIAVTLVATFRTGAKIALWHSLLAMAVLNVVAAGLAGPAEPMPVAAFTTYLGGLWAIGLGTAMLAAVNERELRRRRHDERVLRELALSVGAEDDPETVAARLAAFGRDELSARRSAVVVFAEDGVMHHPRDIVAVVDEDGRTAVAPLSPPARRPDLRPDVVQLVHAPDPVQDEWLCGALPDARNLVVVPFAVPHASGALILEQQRHRAARLARRVERRLIATARQAAAQSAMAVARAAVAARLAAAAHTDGLTGTANRRRFDTVLAESVVGADPFVLALLDLDHFKAINDTYGHQTGDAVLRAVGSALRDAVGAEALVARYGGEEFAVLVAARAVDAPVVAEVLRSAVAGAGAPVPVTVSVGVASFPHDHVTGDALVEAADRRLYTAKRSGRDRAVTADQPLYATEMSRGPSQPAGRPADVAV